MPHLVEHTRNNIPVFIDLISSDAGKQIAQQPHLLTLAAEALRRTTLDGHNVNLEHDMRRVIGYDFVVEAVDSDTIFYAQLVRDDVYTRFVKNGKPLSTRCLTTILRADKTGAQYNLENLWIGRLTPPRPGSTKETAKSKPYWEKHARVFENQPIQQRTLTKTCPY